GIVVVEGLEPPLDRNDPLELPGVVRHRLSIVIGINDRSGGSGTDDGAHDRQSLETWHRTTGSSFARNPIALKASAFGHQPWARGIIQQSVANRLGRRARSAARGSWTDAQGMGRAAGSPIARRRGG